MLKHRTTFGWTLLGLLILLPLAASLSLSSRAVAPALLQFQTQGHVLGFVRDALFVSNAAYALRVEFVDANHVAPTSTANNADQGGSAVPLSRVTYPNLWDGITLTYDAPAGGIVRSTYTLAPSARVENISLRYNAPVTVNADGSLAVSYENGRVSESAPVAWQDINGTRVLVTVAFVTQGERQVGFSLGEHDPRAPVVIDPVLTWNTFLGGKKIDGGWGIALDTDGNVFVIGYASGSWGTPVRPFEGNQDAFVAKLDPNGSLVWNTFLGGSEYDTAIGLATGSNGHVYVAGGSGSTWGTPVRNHSGSSDSFVAELDSNGNLLWNTFLGEAADDYSIGIALDADGNIFTSGSSFSTWGTPVRAHTGNWDGFAAKLEHDGELVWNTFLGGATGDAGNRVAIDSSGNVFVSGRSDSSWGSPMRAHTSESDAFVAKLDSDGELAWNTFLGGDQADEGIDIALDGNGNVIVSGNSSLSWGNPVGAFAGADAIERGSAAKYETMSSPASPSPYYLSNQSPFQAPELGGGDAFVAKLDMDGALIWNTFLGGKGGDGSIGVSADASGNVYVSGYSYKGWGNPVRPYTFGMDAFAAKLDTNGALTMNTFLGGAKDDAGTGIAVNANGDIFIRGNSLASWSNPFRAHGGDFDAFAVRIPAAPACDVKPDKPVLLKPSNKSTLKGPDIKLDWADTACATGSKVMVRQGSPTGALVLKEANPDKSQIVAPGLKPGTTYYWRVTTNNSFGKTKSAWSKFTVGTQNSTVYIRNLTGGTLCYEILNTGIGKKCFPSAGDSLYGTFLAGNYTWQASAPCGTDSNVLYYPPQIVTHWFSCDESERRAPRSGVEQGGTMK